VLFLKLFANLFLLCGKRACVSCALAALGISHSATHTEVKWTARGGAIIERMIPVLIRYTTGSDLVEEQLKMATGQPPASIMPPCGFAGISFLTSGTPGILHEVRGSDTARAMEGIVHLEPPLAPGAYVAPPSSAYDRLGCVIAYSQTYREVAARQQSAMTTIGFVMRPETAEQEKRQG
jgi:hypothetical protein